VAIYQDNKGHGGAVNTGIREAKGKYFKVVDSDDWVDTRAYLKILESLQALEDENTPVDAFISNFVYEKEDNLVKNPCFINPLCLRTVYSAGKMLVPFQRDSVHDDAFLDLQD